MDFLDRWGGAGWRTRALRWIVAAGCLVLGSWLIHGAYGDPSILVVVGKSLVALFLLIPVALLVLPEVLGFLAAPFFAFIDSTFFPGGKGDPPRLDYRLADHYREGGRWEDLAETYERILRYYPGELRPYEELIALYAGELDRPRRARVLLRRARRHLSEEELLFLEAAAR